MPDSIKNAVDILLNSNRVVVSTGAGVSKESGIPTFRETQSGLWQNFDPEELCTLQGFLKNPPLVWNWYQDRIKIIETVEPNPGHYALVKLEKMFDKFDLITQNIDNLHQKAGSKYVYEIHGTSRTLSCIECSTEYELNLIDLNFLPPTCYICKGILKPDIVFFNEKIPAFALKRSKEESLKADVLIIIGTNAEVLPAADIPVKAKENGALIIEINIQESHFTHTITDIFLKGKASDIMSKIGEFLYLD